MAGELDRISTLPLPNGNNNKNSITTKKSKQGSNMTSPQFTNQQPSLPTDYCCDNQGVWQQESNSCYNSPSNPRKGIKKQYSQLLKKNIAKKLMQRRASDITGSTVNKSADGTPSSKPNSGQDNKDTSMQSSHNVTLVNHIRDNSGAYVISTVELVKKPGVSIGFYIRNGDGFDRLDGIFVSRIALGSIVDVNHLVQIGDELLYVNNISVTDMTLDDIVVLLRIPTKLSLTVKRRISASTRNSPITTIPCDDGSQHSDTDQYATSHSKRQPSSKVANHENANNRHRDDDHHQQLSNATYNDHHFQQDVSDPRATTTQLSLPSRKTNCRRSSDLLFNARKGMPSSLEILNEGSVIDYGQINNISNRHQVVSPVTNRFYQTGNDSSYFSATESYDSTSENYNYNSDSNHEDSDTQQESMPSPTPIGARNQKSNHVSAIASQQQHQDDDESDKALLSPPFHEDRRHTFPMLPFDTLPNQHGLKHQSESVVVERHHEDIIMTISSQSEADNSSMQSSDDSVRPDNSISSDEDESKMVKLANNLADKISLQLELRDQNNNHPSHHLPVIAIDSDYTDSGTSTPVLDAPSSSSDQSTPTSPVLAPSPLITTNTTTTTTHQDKSSQITSDQRERSYSADDDELSSHQENKNHHGKILDSSKMTLTPGLARANQVKKDKKKLRFKNTANLLSVPSPVGTPVLNGKGNKKLSNNNKRNRSKSLSAIVGMGLVAAQASSIPSDNLPSTTKQKSSGSKKKLFSNPKSSSRQQILDVPGMLGLTSNNASGSATPATVKKSQRNPSYTQFELDHHFIAHYSENIQLGITPSNDTKDPLLSGRLSMNLLCGKDMTAASGSNSNNCKQRDVYCVIEIDNELQAKTNSKRGTTSFDWDESFEIDLDCCRYVTFKCYVGSSKSARLHHKSLFVTGNINFAKLVTSYGCNHQIALHTKPFGVIYAKLNFIGQESTFQRRPSSRSAGVFGVELATVTRREGNQVPQIVQKCIAAIEERGMDIVGLYRLCGSAKRKQALRAEFEFNANSVDLTDIDRYPDINVVTGILKDYLRELPEPLFTNQLYQTLLDSQDIIESENYYTAVLDLIHSLPEPNYATLSFILDHLVHVGKLENSNKMSFHNLAICFGQVLMCSSKDTTTSPFGDPKAVNKAIPLQSMTQDFRQHIIILERILQAWNQYIDNDKVLPQAKIQPEKDVAKTDNISSDVQTDSDDDSESYV